MIADTQRMILLRHGETTANRERRYAGVTDVPVSDEGLAALHRMRTAGLYPDFSGYVPYVTGLARTRQTLEALCPGLGAAALSSLNEMDFGAFEMRTYDQLKGDPDYRRWIADTAGAVPCPGGESAQQFRRRVRAGFDALVSLKQNALIITHGGVISCLMEGLFPAEDKDFYQWQPAYGRGYLIELSGGRPAFYHSIPNEP